MYPRRRQRRSADLPTFAELASYKRARHEHRRAADLRAAGARRQRQHRALAVRADAKAAGLDIITWTLERSGILADGNNGFYYQTIDSAIKREGDMYRVLDVLAKDVGILGIFSDWAAPVTFYANCMGLK